MSNVTNINAKRLETTIENSSISKDYIKPNVLTYIEDVCETDSEDILLLWDNEEVLDQCDYEIDSHKYGSPSVLESTCYDLDLYVWCDLSTGWKYYSSVRIAKHNLFCFDY